MCLIGIFLSEDGDLTIAANRDEFADRPSLPMHWWPEGILAGKDLRAGGTWLGVSKTGRFAAVTNVRDPKIKHNPIPSSSRGLLASEFLLSNVPPEEFLYGIRDQLLAPSAFNLVVGTISNAGSHLFWLGGRKREVNPISAGCHVLSNAELNAPWPKALRLKEVLDQGNSQALLAELSNPKVYPPHLLPDTGVSLDWESRLSAALITGEDYHTRATTIIQYAQNKLHIREITRNIHGAPEKEVVFDEVFADC